MPRLRSTIATLVVLAGLVAAAGPARAKTMVLDGPRPTIVNVFYGDLAVGTPRTFKGVAVYPLTTRRPHPLAGVLTLDEALADGSLRVTELPNASVNELQLENVGKRPVFIMAGEIMEGAKQDRMLQNDLLVPPVSGPMRVSVFCTEHGRWTEGASRFGAAQAAVPNSVRGAAKAAAPSQSRVWDQIAENQRKLAVQAPTGAARDVYAAPRIKQDMGPYLDALGGLPRWQSGTVGVACAFGAKIVAIDSFGDAAMFARLYPKLLRSYLVDVLGDAWHGATTTADVRETLERAENGTWEFAKTEGQGDALRFDGGAMRGTALTKVPAILHTDLFVPPPAPAVRPGDVRQQNPPPNLDIRRQRP